MKFNTSKLIFSLALLCAMLSGIGTSAQTHTRYILPSELGSDKLYSDSLLSSIPLPWGVSRVDCYPAVERAAAELSEILKNKNIRLLSVYVSGSTSPDGLWQGNVSLSQARTDATASYLQYVTDVPAEKIHKKSLVEDWDRLCEMIEASDLQYKEEALEIIRTKTWGERKEALKNLDGGSVWNILMEDFFPELRCVRIAFYCEKIAPAIEKESKKIAADTVFIRDTVYYVRETHYIPIETRTYDHGNGDVITSAPVAVPASVPVQLSTQASTAAQTKTPAPSQTQKQKPAPTQAPVHEINHAVPEPVYHAPAKPLLMGIKTNLIGDLMVIPSLGAEIQITDKFSFDFQGFFTKHNTFNKFDENTNVYGFSPEFRYWTGGDAMTKGQFIGLHARFAWYTLQWKDDLLYQNGPENVWEGNYHDAGNSTPAWSIGFTYGYSLAFGGKDQWGLEFLLGVGYSKYSQNVAAYNSGIWELVEHQNKSNFGLTRAGINLVYRFSLRKATPKYYENL